MGRQLQMLCAKKDIGVDVLWSPREEKHHKLADMWFQGGE